MKKILIVDDNASNRMFLHVLLEEYAAENDGVAFELSEAENGIEAVSLALSEHFDLILMDIMMPEMDGIEATKKIRKANKEVMVIAVSAIDDEIRKKEILNSGAEDYISKPVNTDVFQSRMSLYLSLIDARSPSVYNATAANLYTKEVFSRQMIFTVSNEDTLSEFWEYYLLSDGLKSDNLSDVIRILNAIGTLMLNAGVGARIIVEESESHRYFTIEGIDRVEQGLIDAILTKNSHIKEYKTARACMTFMLSKVLSNGCNHIEECAYVVNQSAVPVSETFPASETAAEAAPVMATSAGENSIYSYLEPEDLEEIENYIGKLDSLFLVAGSSEITEEEVVEIYTYLDRIGRMMTTYSESYRCGQAITALSQDINVNSETFRSNSTALAPMCEAFNRDLSTWVRMMFYEGAPSVDYMDDTIIANTQTISGMLKMDEAPADDDAGLDDIFDF